MRTYISREYTIIQSWIAVVIAAFFILLGLIIITCLGFFHDSHLDFTPFILIILGFAQYAAIRNRLIFVEKNKIIVKGVFSSKTYDIADFKEVSRDWWGLGNQYSITFHDGTYYRFLPSWKFRRGSFVMVVPNTIIVDNINAFINGLK